MRVITFICEEGVRFMAEWSVVIGELRQRQKVIPIVLVIVDIDPQVLPPGFDSSARLTVGLRVVSGREVRLMWRRRQSEDQKSDTNVLPRSETMSEGAPCLEKTWRRYS